MEKLFQLAKNGRDDEALDQIVGHYRGPLAGFVRARLSHRLREFVDVEDIVQDTFARAFQRLERIEWQGEKAFSSWLCGIAMNVLRESSRHYLKIDIETRNQEYAGSTATPSRHQRRDERFERLKAALNQLSDDHREVITLSRIHGLPTKEVGERMNRSVEATYQLLWRATKQLKEVFGDTESLRLPARSIELESERDH